MILHTCQTQLARESDPFDAVVLGYCMILVIVLSSN